MPIDLQRIVNSPSGLSLASGLARGLPPRLGYFIADFIAERLAKQWQSPVVRAVRANQWVALGEPAEKEVLNQAVRATLRHSARSVFALHHYIHRPETTRQLIILDSTIQQLVHRPEFADRGLVVVSLHLSNFDLVLQWLGKQGMKPLVLTIPDPQGGRRLEFEMRNRTGLNLVPASVGALRQALRHLEQGGIVATGIDRPIPKPATRPRFFGRLAALPLHHIFLATKARVPVLMAVAKQQPDGKYYVVASEPIEMEPAPNREIEVLHNAEKVLNIAAGFIRQAPHQWSVSLPVWPETLDLAPI